MALSAQAPGTVLAPSLTEVVHFSSGSLFMPTAIAFGGFPSASDLFRVPKQGTDDEQG